MALIDWVAWMNLTNREADIIFAIMRELSGEFSHDEVRTRVGKQLLDLLDADYFASYVWNDAQGKFVSGVQLNMSDSNLAQYDEYYQFHDPITHKLQRRHKATPVSEIMAHEKLKNTDHCQQKEACTAVPLCRPVCSLLTNPSAVRLTSGGRRRGGGLRGVRGGELG